MVEHRLGKGEVVSSILPGSTIKAPRNKGFSASLKIPSRNSRRNEARIRRFEWCKIRGLRSPLPGKARSY